ncbi:MAG: hypothetical protein LBN33_06035 [Desulfovibrio sp.]|jgi:hypothetical protein|nr:hypothetical protein [Desulfovibrio sp.]
MVTNKPPIVFQSATNPGAAEVKRKAGRMDRIQESFASYLPAEQNSRKMQAGPSALKLANYGAAMPPAALAPTSATSTPGRAAALPSSASPYAQSTGSVQAATMPSPASPYAQSMGSGRSLLPASADLSPVPGTGSGRIAPAAGKESTTAKNSAPANSNARPEGLYVKSAPLPVRRIPGQQPITGRNGIGMEDTRKRTDPALTTQTPVAPAYRPNEVNQFNMRYNPTGSGSNNFMTRGFASKNADLALKNLGYRASEQNKIETKATLLEAIPAELRGNAAADPGKIRPQEFARGDAAARQAVKRQSRDLSPANNINRPTPVNAQIALEPGALAAKFESGDEGIAAIGYDGKGGTSYGKFQIASRPGTMRNFISYLQNKAPDMARRLSAAGPADTGGKSGRMPTEWRKIAAEDPARFDELQSDFIRTTHVEPAKDAITEATGVNFEQLPTALREVLFSTAVQHGPAGATRIINRAMESVNRDKLMTAKNETSAQNEGRRLITQIYNLRAGQFSSSTSRVQSAVRNRLRQEMQEAIQMLS